MTYNILDGGVGREAAIVEVIRSLTPDVVVLQEVMQLWFQAGHVLRHALRLILDTGYVDCFRTLHPHQGGFTLPAPDPSIRLDYIFANLIMSTQLCACQVVTQPEVAKTASDHLPVLAEFRCGD